jgi:type II secretory pathway predicted ATPase ExeA
MFLSYYRLREQPFGVTPDPRFLYETAVHREALASLLYGIESAIGFTALLAPPGMGKTTLLFHLLERYRRVAQSAFIFDTQCNSLEFIQSMCSDLELNTSGTDAELRARFKEHLAAQASSGRRVLVLIDEAQNLELEVLETVRLLSNFETPREKLLHIILSGQPQLEANLARPEMAQLRQRITMFTRLSPFAPEDTAAYIEHRLKVAGHRGRPLFTPNALAIIAAESHGVPREINRLCFNALSLGFAVQKHAIDAEVLYEVVNDLRLGSEPMPPIAWPGLVAGEQPAECSARVNRNPVQNELAVVAVEPVAVLDPFAPAARPSRAPCSEQLAVPQPVTVAASEPVAARPIVQDQIAEEVSGTTVGNPEVAVQRALLNVALKSHHKSSYIPLAGVALIIPLVLWIIAYLIFRFDIVSLLGQH